jgi:hypothetical protein
MGEINLRTSNGLINPFNQLILEMVRCNMDITFISSGYSALAVLYYITDYISKQQLKTHIAYNLLEHALTHLNQYNNSDDTDHVRAKRILMRCANAVISKQELSAQQVASYLLGSSDFYASHSFKDFYWKTYEGYILHCLPDTQTNQEEVLGDEDPLINTDEELSATNALPHAANEDPESDSHSNSSSDIDISEGDSITSCDYPNHEEGLSDGALNHLAHPAFQCNEYVTVSFDTNGVLKPKASTVCDYIYRPKEMLSLCLWDFLSMTNKICLTHCTSTLTADDIDDAENSDTETSKSSNDGRLSLESVSSDEPVLNVIEGMYMGTLKKPTLLFDERHPDHSTHMVQILPPPRHYTLVPLGPPIPRRDRPMSFESYCRLMLIFFKPWLVVSDLKPLHTSWSHAFENFMLSDDILHEHSVIIENLQFLHTCRDSRDEASKTHSQCKLPRGILTDDIHAMPADLSSFTDENAVAAIQDDFSDLLLDTYQQVQRTLEDVHCCLRALAIGDPSLQCEPINPSHPTAELHEHGPHVVPATPELMALIPIWRTEYATRRKAQKQNIQQSENVPPPLASDIGESSLMIIHDSNGPSPQNEPTEGPQSDLSLTQLTSAQPSHQDTKESIANQWTLNADQKQAFDIVADHAVEPLEKHHLRCC